MKVINLRTQEVAIPTKRIDDLKQFAKNLNLERLSVDNICEDAVIVSGPGSFRKVKSVKDGYVLLDLRDEEPAALIFPTLETIVNFMYDHIKLSLLSKGFTYKTIEREMTKLYIANPRNVKFI